MRGIFGHAKRLFKAIVLPTIITLILCIGIAFAVYTVAKPFFPSDFIENIKDYDPEDIQIFMLELTEIMEENQVQLYGIIAVATLVFNIVTTWLLNIGFIMSKQLIENEESNFSEALSQSFNRNYGRLFVYAIITTLLSTAVGVVLIPVESISAVLGSILQIVANVVLLRLFAGRGAIVYGDLDVKSALKFSWENITMGRAIKLYLLIIVGAIGAALVLGLTVVPLTMLGGVGAGLIFLVSLFLLVFMVAFMISGYAAAFYRYVEVEYQEDNEDSHLIDDQSDVL